jgi:hypothetical protein
MIYNLIAILFVLAGINSMMILKSRKDINGLGIRLSKKIEGKDNRQHLYA